MMPLRDPRSAAVFSNCGELPMKMRCHVTLQEKFYGKNEEIAESPDRRQFLRCGLIGGAAALLLSSASRQVLADSMTLNPQEMEAARRARQAPDEANRVAGRMKASTAYPAGTCSGCEGSCTGTCTGGCASGCTGACSGTCTGSCTGSCASGCTGSK